MNTTFLSLDYFSKFNDKEKFLAAVTREKSVKRVVDLVILLILFSALYGLLMGSYHSTEQAFSSMFKLPLLFLLEILICFPAFFMIQFVLGSRLRFTQMLIIILTGFVLTSLIMVSFSTIALFFMITGSNYHFLKLLHVAIITFSAIFGMKTIIEALKYSCESKNIYPKTGVQVFRLWILILAFVGMQLSWNLRPFIATKSLPFELFRNRSGNFYVDVLISTASILDPNFNKHRRVPARTPAPVPVQPDLLK